MTLEDVPVLFLLPYRNGVQALKGIRMTEWAGKSEFERSVRTHKTFDVPKDGSFEPDEHWTD